MFGADLSEREVAYLMEHEWARTAEDVLWRRSKLGFHITDADAARLADWMTSASEKVHTPVAMAVGGTA
jgi:glycerol-3-phosphate dehydrogenase